MGAPAAAGGAAGAAAVANEGDDPEWFLSPAAAAALTDAPSAERALAAARRREAAVHAELEAVVRGRPAVARELGALAEQASVVDLVSTDLSHLTVSVKHASALADSISSKVRSARAEARGAAVIERLREVLLPRAEQSPRRHAAPRTGRARRDFSHHLLFA